MQALPSAVQVRALVDSEKGLVDRRAFTEENIYQLELERIFARAWNFMCHDSQIPNAGDFFSTFIGEDRVIVVRDNDGLPQVLVNSCRHRGNAVCRAEEGHASSFMCTYHGWTYDLKGNLVGVPGFKEVYHEELDRENWGLIRAAKVASYKGFVFATLDPNAPDLEEYLGDVGRLAIDLTAERGNLHVAPGIQKYTIPCNWKLAVENCWDFYHAWLTHSSATLSGYSSGSYRVQDRRLSLYPERRHIVLLAPYGHVISGPAVAPEVMPDPEPTGPNSPWRERPEAKAVLGPVGLRARHYPHLFPNLWFAQPGDGQVSLRIPRGPNKTEIWWFTFVDENGSSQRQASQIRAAVRHFGPGGIFEQDDGDNWAEGTRGSAGLMTKKYPFNYSINLHRGEVRDDEEGPPWIETGINEHGQLWFYRNWASWLASENWEQLNDERPGLPDVV